LASTIFRFREDGKGVDKIGEILRAYLEQARPIKEIVRTLSVSRATVRKGKAAPIVPPCLRIP
jgi:hypothetical protein